ncbi:hypothetical protein MCUN1_002857 [Malassezia cuniculi]|uniref:Uncharacterized protein n=1 Tax=Malassezia cuniculi TaxID=948313 RepID=A0AAF0JCJ7_9BASI|nr:hypothetical protein MCUN1_002857 [Malassezia cuniculi]
MSSLALNLPLVSPLATRILELKGFSLALRTRDIHALLRPWEDEKGGYRIKWVDDETAYLVFADAGVAKHAYLRITSTPPNILRYDYTGDFTGDAWEHVGDRMVENMYATVTPYTGPDAANIIAVTSNATSRRTSGAYKARSPMRSTPSASLSEDVFLKVDSSA